MQIFPKLMEQNNVPIKYWPLYTDITCQECKKEQTLANYRNHQSKCVKCGSKINV